MTQTQKRIKSGCLKQDVELVVCKIVFDTRLGIPTSLLGCVERVSLGAGVGAKGFMSTLLVARFALVAALLGAVVDAAISEPGKASTTAVEVVFVFALEQNPHDTSQ